MTIRSYRCSLCNQEMETDVPIERPSPVEYCCDRKMDSVFSLETTPNVGAFESYVEESLPGGPVEITNRSQRDALCEQHNVTYDRYGEQLLKQNRRRVSAANDVTYDQAMTQCKKDLGEWS